MSLFDWQASCFEISEAEDKLISLRIRKIKQLLKWLGSVKQDYAISEGIDLQQLEESQQFLGVELWLRQMQKRGEIER